jgi:hypothetical protein
LAVEAEDIDAELGVRESWVSAAAVGVSGALYCMELSMDSFGLVSFWSVDEAVGCAGGS